MKRSFGVLGLFLGVMLLSIGFVSACENCCITDKIDIGNPASEDRHNLKGWGPIEPATHGGNWGGISAMDDSTTRTIWYNNDQTHKSKMDKPEATFILKGCNCHTNKRCSDCMGCSHDSKKGIVLNVLDGIADDSFMVYVNGKKYYTYEDSSDTEVWKEHDIDLSKLRSPTYSVRVVATGDKWEMFDTYGQLAISNVYAYC